MSDKCVIVSVVRDFDMYRRCVSENPHNSGLSFVAADNRLENEHVAVLYNRFLDEFDYSSPAWFVFCHEDFEFLESIAEKVGVLDVGAIYGPIGGRLLCRRQWMLGGMWPGEYVGSVIQSEKDGSNQVVIGSAVPTGTIADALDCQCLIVHSSLVQAHHLRFDERLSFDLYAEDFCLDAMVEHGVPTFCTASTGIGQFNPRTSNMVYALLLLLRTESTARNAKPAISTHRTGPAPIPAALEARP